MDQEKRRTALPEREEMLARLVKMDGSVHLQQHLYPTLLIEARTEKTAGQIARWIGLAFYDYAATLPGPMVIVMMKFALDYVNILIDDKEIATEAKALLREILASEGISTEESDPIDTGDSFETCNQPMGYVSDTTDCDDSDSRTNIDE